MDTLRDQLTSSPILAGTPKLVSPTTRQSRQAQQAVVTDFNTPFYMILLGFLSLISHSLSAQLQQDIAAGRVILDDQVLEVKKEIAGGGTIDLLDGTTHRIDGICSFDKNGLMDGRAFLFNEVAIGYGTNAASGKEGEIEYDVKAPAVLQNALFIINQNGREVLRMPVRDLHNIHTGTHEDQEYCVLKSIRHLVDGKNVTMQIKFPPSATLGGTDKHYIYVRLRGVQTSIKPTT